MTIAIFEHHDVSCGVDWSCAGGDISGRPSGWHGRPSVKLGQPHLEGLG